MFEYIEEQIIFILQTLAEDAGVPIKTGNLRKAIKYKQTDSGFQVYIDEAQAPYAKDVEAITPFWNQVFLVLSYRLAEMLEAKGYLE